jgi:Large polyvalent protein-associated domain 7
VTLLKGVGAMPKSLDETGVIQVDGAWATSVKYVAEALGPNVGTVDLRFMQGRAEVGRVAVSREHLSDLLGEQNRSAIERHIANDADKYLPVVTGELRGRRLHYQEVTLATSAPRAAENSIAATPTPERVPGVETRLEPPGDSAQDRGPQPNLNAPDAFDGNTEKRRRANETQGSESSTRPVAPVPAHIAAKYLVKGNVYHFDDQTVAFVDKGTALTVKTHNKAIIHDLVTIAQARDWQAVTVSGTQAFRREAWKAAAAAGLSVSGYTPSEIERVAVDRERGRRAPSKPSEIVRGETASARGAPESAAPREPGAGSPDAKRDIGVRYGTLVAHGEAPYRHDSSQSASYFVTLKDAAGHERTTWGVGLKDALLESKTAAAVNDWVGIRRVGSTPVTVVQRSVDEDGEVVAQAIGAKRHNWEVEKAEHFKQRSGAPSQDHRPTSTVSEKTAVSTPKEQPAQEFGTQGLTREQEAAAAIRSAATTREELQLKFPELNKAVFQHLASHDQFAEAYVKSGLIRESDRAQVIAQMRERLASKLERGAIIREPDNKEVNTLIRRSVNRVAADIGRPPIEIQPRSPDPPSARAVVTREDVQVRA